MEIRKEKYTEPMVTDADGNVYVSMKTLKEYTEKYVTALKDIQNLLENNAVLNNLVITIINIINKALGDDK